MRFSGNAAIAACVSLLLAAAGTTGALAGTTGAMAVAHPEHGPIIPPDPWAVSAASSDFSELTGVFCTSAADCWAVGDQGTSTVRLNQVLHLTGKKWSAVPVRSPGGTKDGAMSELTAVRCPSAGDCWAVGFYRSPGSARLAEMLRWNGKKWRIVSIPEPGGTRRDEFTFLADISCTSAASCLAVGFYGKQGKTEIGATRNLVLRWDGQNWSQVHTPNPAGMKQSQFNALASVRCASPSDCWAAGEDGKDTARELISLNEMLHWNGKSWMNVAVPNPARAANGTDRAINSLSCTASTNCWAAGISGSFRTDRQFNSVLHWTGRKWFKVAVPNPTGSGDAATNVLNGINCVSARDCWAVGFDGIEVGGNPQFSEILHWDGATWSAAKIPNAAGSGSDARSALSAVRCVSATNCWAVGWEFPEGGKEVNQILHWNGVKWKVAS
ncbi:MAG TPA: hypothetical protein VFI65_30700 [Streptosporangiaceae bacterium]|nr:hypothetical protein [Streptosporangiaceae bacterium]